jgi:hypothetical protein
MGHLRQKTLVARVDDDADRKAVDHGRSERFLGGKAVARHSIPVICTNIIFGEQTSDR